MNCIEADKANCNNCHHAKRYVNNIAFNKHDVFISVQHICSPNYLDTPNDSFPHAGLVIRDLRKNICNGFIYKQQSE